MARPIKQGLDYFPFDVDFFNDEKIVAIAGEFGIKGEITTIKLLCAVYRNGYFIEWSEMLKFKLLKDLPGVSPDLLDQIVKRLIKWDFFDKNLFDSASILTSKGIQRRYKTISTKMHRKNNAISEYYISDLNNDINPPSTPKKSTFQKTEKDTHESIFAISLDKAVGSMSSDTHWIESVCLRFSISKDTFEEKLIDFKQACICMDKVSHKDISDAKRHFCSWLKKNTTSIRPSSTPKQPQKKISAPEPEDPEEARFRKLIPAPGNKLIMNFAQYQALGLDRMSDEQVRTFCNEVLKGSRKIPSIIDLLKK